MTPLKLAFPSYGLRLSPKNQLGKKKRTPIAKEIPKAAATATATAVASANRHTSLYPPRVISNF